MPAGVSFDSLITADEIAWMVVMYRFLPQSDLNCETMKGTRDLARRTALYFWNIGPVSARV